MKTKVKDNEFIKNLSGHSGCNVVLKQKENSLIVEKSASTIKYNYRLKRQCKKQDKFLSKNSVHVPKILNYGYKDNLFYFDMEFVSGKTLAEYIEDISIMEIASHMKCLFSSLYMNNNFANSTAMTIFRNKISALKIELSDYKQLNEIFNSLEEYDWSKVHKSPCHGDLTLENIILGADKNLYLIDFLDSFYNSWMIDIAKLLQDLELKWSFRNKTISKNMELRLLVAKEILIEEILKRDNGFEDVKTIYHLLCLNIVRIYPYVKDVATLEFLNSSIEFLAGKIKNLKKGEI